MWQHKQQESIPEGCVPPDYRSYPMVSGGGRVPNPLYISTPADAPAPEHTHAPDIPISWKEPGTRNTHPLERTWYQRYPLLVRTWDQRHPPPPSTDRHLWRHYLPATSFAGGKNRTKEERGMGMVQKAETCNIKLLTLTKKVGWSSYLHLTNLSNRVFP